MRIKSIIQGAQREPSVRYLAHRTHSLGASRADISVYPHASTAAGACDVTSIRDADDPRSGCASARFRILKVTQSYYPFLERGGPAVKVRALARGLARRGHSVTVLTSDLGIKGSMKLTGGMARTPEGWRFEEDGVETHYLFARGSFRSLTWNPGILRFCRKWLKFDIVHIYGTYDLLGPSVARACRERDIPYLLEPMGMFRPMVRNLALKWVYRQLLGESVVRGAARLVATSLQECRELIEEGITSRKIIVRRNGIEMPALSPLAGTFRSHWKIPQDALLVLFLGRIVSKKSPELLLEAFDAWRRSSPLAQSLILVFAGPFEDGNYRESLQSQVKRLGLVASVLFTGPLYGDVKWSALADADIFVLPSQNENFGNAAAEAVACGTPVIVTDRCGIAPLIDGRAGLVIPHQCEALIRALHQLSEAGTRERLKLGCAEVTRGLSWDQPLAETEALYAELLNGPRAVRPEPGREARNALREPELER
jgi:glycosyltransferase involved in cell wall biosynthesis